MAKFMDVHSGFVGVTEDQLREAHERDLAVEAAEDVHFERAWLDPGSGKAFCLSSGPSKEAVLRVHDKAGHPTTEMRPRPALAAAPRKPAPPAPQVTALSPPPPAPTAPARPGPEAGRARK